MSAPPRVILINPPVTERQRSGPIGPVIRNLYFNSPPLGLAYLAAVLERAGSKVELMDAAVEGFSMADAVERVRAFAPDVAGVTSTTNYFGNALELARLLKAALPALPVMIGGPHATRNPEAMLEHPCFDAVCIGEGERTVLELVAALGGGAGLSEVKGIAFRAGGLPRLTEPRELIENMDEIPMPARHLLPLSKYVPQPNDGPYVPKFAMITSRGCPYECIFCDHGIFGVSYRSFSPARIVDEAEQLVNRFGARDIAFVDSLFMPTVKRVRDIVEEMQRRKLRVHWTCTIRANVATREILDEMKRAGCWRVRIGVESGNEEVLKFIRKRVTKDQVRKVARNAHAAGLHPKAFFMIGHPTDTEATIRESIAFAKELPLTDITVQINTPMPGALQSTFIRDYGTIVTDDLERYSFWEPVFVPRGLTRERMIELYREFYRSFYLRPAIWWRHLRMFKNWNDFARYARALRLLVNMFIRKRPSAAEEACG